MLKLKALLLTQGMHGMVSQVEGLANGLKLRFKHQKSKIKTLEFCSTEIHTDFGKFINRKICFDSK